MTYSPLQLAEAFVQAGELDDALDALNVQLHLTPDAAPARRMRAQVLARGAASGWPLALDDLAALASPTADDAFLRITLLERLKDPHAALAAAAAATALYPEDDRLLERYILLLRAQGDLTTARTLVEQRRANTAAVDWRWQQWAGDLAVDAGDDAAAVQAFTAALETIQARYAFSLDLPAAVLTNALNDAVALTITGVAARLVLARAHAQRRQRQLTAAEADYLTAQRLLPDDPTIAFYRGLVLALREEWAEAEKVCQSSLAQASATVRKHLRAALEEDPAYAPLIARVQQ